MSSQIYTAILNLVSPLDGLDSPDTLVKRAKEIGLNGLAITDHGTLAGHRDMFKAGVENEFPILLGLEAYFSGSNDRFDRRSKAKRQEGEDVYNHLIIIAKNDTGLRNLQAISSASWTESFYNKPLCLMPGQEIITSTGTKNIEDIQVGDVVMTHKGRFRKVTRTYENDYDGEMIGIKLNFRYNRITWMTPEHPVLIRSRDGSLDWVQAKDIKSGRSKGQRSNAAHWFSWVCLPKQKNEQIIEEIDIDKFTEWRPSNSDKGNWEKVNVRKTIKNSMHYRTAERYWKLDYDMGRLFGLYLAEGFSSNSCLSFAFHEDEVEYHEFVINKLKTLFPKSSIGKRTYPNRPEYKGVTVYLESMIATQIFSNLMGNGSVNKHAPDFLFEAPEDFQRGVFEGCLEGDGALGRNDTAIPFTQTSETLYWQMRMLGAKFRNDFSNLVIGKKNKEHHSKQYRTVFSKLSEDSYRNVKFDENFVYKPVSSLEKKHYNGKVYNIEVEEDHSYISDFSMHNCDMEILEDNKEGLIITSACVSGLVAKALREKDPERAERWALDFKRVFADDFYIELQDHNDDIEPGLNEALLNLADKLNIKPIITTDTHFAKPEDRWIEDALLILNTNPGKAKDFDLSHAHKLEFMDMYNYLYPNRTMSFQDIDVFLQNGETLYQKMCKRGITRTDIYSNTLEIMEKLGD